MICNDGDLANECLGELGHRSEGVLSAMETEEAKAENHRIPV